MDASIQDLLAQQETDLEFQGLEELGVVLIVVFIREEQIQMREIKFRGKRLDNGEWVYGFLIQYENGWFICNFIGDAYQYEVDPSTVGQFTGLKDKNGKEIYEGDVVRIDDLGIGIVDYEDGRFAMRRREERFCWPVYCRIDHSPFVPEVIGNIHDNSDPLKGADTK